MRRYKLFLILLFVTAIFCALVSLVFIMPERFGLCPENNDACLYKYIDYEWMTAPIFLFAICTVFITAVLFFNEELVFWAWLKFALPWIIFSVFLISITPEFSGGWGISFPFNREIALWVTSGGFLFISFLLIFWKWWQVRKGDTVKT